MEVMLCICIVYILDWVVSVLIMVVGVLCFLMGVLLVMSVVRNCLCEVFMSMLWLREVNCGRCFSSC